jgi:hypothetical protein
MSKKLYFLLLLTIPFYTSTQSFNRAESPTTSAEYAQDDVFTHIAQAKKDIMAELKQVTTLLERSEDHFGELFADHYETTKQTCLYLLNDLLESPEYATSFEQATQEQFDLITDQMVNYNDIMLDPSQYPLEQKLKAVLKEASLDEQTKQLFNVFYITVSTILNAKCLCGKLEAKEKELRAAQIEAHQ